MMYHGYYATTTSAVMMTESTSHMTLLAGTGYAFSSTASSTIAWATTGLIVVAKTSLDYRKYKKGFMSKD